MLAAEFTTSKAAVIGVGDGTEHCDEKHQCEDNASSFHDELENGDCWQTNPKQRNAMTVDNAMRGAQNQVHKTSQHNRKLSLSIHYFHSGSFS